MNAVGEGPGHLRSPNRISKRKLKFSHIFSCAGKKWTTIWRLRTASPRTPVVFLCRSLAGRSSRTILYFSFSFAKDRTVISSRSPFFFFVLIHEEISKKINENGGLYPKIRLWCKTPLRLLRQRWNAEGQNNISFPFYTSLCALFIGCNMSSEREREKKKTASALHIPKVSFATSSRATYHDINQATEFTFSSSKNLFLKLKLTYLGPKYLRGK